MSKAIVTLTFFKYKGFKNAWWAFVQMGVLPKLLKNIEGVSFVKMLGSGGKEGFSILPNFGLYGLLCVWEEQSFSEQFFQSSEIFLKLKQRATHCQTIFLETLQAHGKWDGCEPFGNPKTKPEPSQKIAVITRASIRWNKIWHFWRVVRPASKNMFAHQGLLFSVGIGELPLVQQATFSIWENVGAMSDYAYKSPQHKKVLLLTKKLDWYSEELFARFSIQKIVGEGIFSISNTSQPSDSLNP
jgi:hypothetical protein